MKALDKEVEKLEKEKEAGKTQAETQVEQAAWELLAEVVFEQAAAAAAELFPTQPIAFPPPPPQDVS